MRGCDHGWARPLQGPRPGRTVKVVARLQEHLDPGSVGRMGSVQVLYPGMQAGMLSIQGLNVK